ncbi:MAG: patatin-like phospholipase family protein [Alphaproteobacteria bacterium]|nr:patatin-like phospholipase family protein [Alphaproteobacteria bacterium]
MKTKSINLALQGGGSHGAYTWGVLDRLLEDERLTIEGVSGTSAGAMNAAVMVNGFARGGRDGARDALAGFWRAISEVGIFSPFYKSPVERMLTGWNLDSSPAYHYFDVLSRMLSPYDLNPLNLNPLRYVLDEFLDLNTLQACSMIKIFITATHVASGQARVFKCHEITTEVLLASACIPFLFQAVEVDGEYYWDGGYMGNPALWPLIYNCRSEDIALVQVNPIYRAQLPKTATEIINRLNEITFNSSLIAEMRAIDFVKRLIDEGRLDRERYKDIRMHLLYSPDELKDLNASSKMNAGWDFFQHLFQLGRAMADTWLAAHFDDIGVRTTVDIRKNFLTGPGKMPAFSELGREKAKRKQADQRNQHATPDQ